MIDLPEFEQQKSPRWGLPGYFPAIPTSGAGVSLGPSVGAIPQ
jgi:hypothetical protein